MIFHITHHHDEKTCPAHDPETVAATFAQILPALQEEGVTVHGAWVDPPGHDFFFVVETDSYDALVNGLMPAVPHGTAAIQPVDDLKARMEKHLADG
tara:strand:- start:14687 stop:14977 length:291 start_codon:yes stop_codon:yes gene_type:complete